MEEITYCSDEEINKGFEEAIKKEAKNIVQGKVRLMFYVSGFQTATIIILAIALLLQ